MKCMKKIFLVLIFLAAYAWSIPKPMESIENYNILMVHGAYGSNKNYMATIKDSLIDTLGFFEGMYNYVMIDFKNMKFENVCSRERGQCSKRVRILRQLLSAARNPQKGDDKDFRASGRRKYGCA